MATNWEIKNAKVVKNIEFLKKAEDLKPKLFKEIDIPIRYYTLQENQHDMQLIEDITQLDFGRDNVLIIEFKNNHPGYFQFFCTSKGSPQDAPALLKFKFCEIKKELFENTSKYYGWIGKGWQQQEMRHVDVMPQRIHFHRRYSFRYVRIDIIDTSQKFRIGFSDIKRDIVSSVQDKQIATILSPDIQLLAIDEVAVRTQKNCMQTVFEDGPKRDQRLWLGDLRIQALVNYKTYGFNDLVKRCLYLFAALPKQDGMVPACLFEKPEPLMDDTFLLDYSLFFVTTLLEYYIYTKDMDTLKELAPTALQQIQLACTYLGENNIIEPEGRYHCFIDWNDKLDKQCAMQGVFMYVLKQGEKICEILGKKEQEKELAFLYEEMSKSSKANLWSEQKQVFISGEGMQISLASQVWMVLAGVLEGDIAKHVLDNEIAHKVEMVTPYMHHFYVMALLKTKQREKAFQHLRAYWGGMILEGADTFWELYNPKNSNESPYGSDSINSYCHAWSCSPAYILREY